MKVPPSTTAMLLRLMQLLGMRLVMALDNGLARTPPMGVSSLPGTINRYSSPHRSKSVQLGLTCLGSVLRYVFHLACDSGTRGTASEWDALAGVSCRSRGQAERRWQPAGATISTSPS
eukprot:SAG31_NODE_1647_length_7645_cov_47.639544_8_plen_118_part_00